jgi:hypothetical protein
MDDLGPALGWTELGIVPIWSLSGSSPLFLTPTSWRVVTHLLLSSEGFSVTPSHIPGKLGKTQFTVQYY